MEWKLSDFEMSLKDVIVCWFNKKI
jgi:hypothetical protein